MATTNVASTNVESTNNVANTNVETAREMERVYMTIEGNHNNVALTSAGDSVVNGTQGAPVRKSDLILSYTKNISPLTTLEEVLPVLLNFVKLRQLVEPYTSNQLPAKNVISIDGVYYTDPQFYDETYSLSLADGSKLIFSGVYYNEGSGSTTSASTQHFSVSMGIGVFVEAKKVTVNYNSDGTRIITVSFY